MPVPDVPHRFEVELQVPGSPEQVWRAIASAEGLSSWMMPTELDPRVGGALTFHMGPDVASHGRVTAFEPPRRIVYEEDWATLVGHAGADVTPLMTEFIVDAVSGGTCVVRVVTSAFGTGADWENEFWDEMSDGWGAVLDNLRLYLDRFADQHATPMFVAVTFASTPEGAIAAVRQKLGADRPGQSVTARGIGATLERTVDRHLVVTLHDPVPGFMSFFSFGSQAESVVHLVGYLFSDSAADDVAREQDGWRRWLEEIAAEMPAAEPSTGR